MSFDEFALICTYSVITVLSQAKSGLSFFIYFPDALCLRLQDEVYSFSTTSSLAVHHQVCGSSIVHHHHPSITVGPHYSRDPKQTDLPGLVCSTWILIHTNCHRTQMILTCIHSRESESFIYACTLFI